MDKSHDYAFRRAVGGADELRGWAVFTCGFVSLEGSSVYAALCYPYQICLSQGLLICSSFTLFVCLS